jgi:proline iminopeptidase
MKRKLLYLVALLFSAVLLVSCKKEIDPKTEGEGTLVPKTVVLDPNLPRISVNGTQLHSEAFGDPSDPMVVYLHGGPGCDYRNALNIKNLVSNHYYVVFYDQRGSGLSERHPMDSYTIQLMLDDLSAVIQHYRTSPSQKIFLFGHSWGAMLATAYLNKYPDAIRGAVLAEPGGFNWEQVKRYSERSRKIKLFDEATNDALYHDQFFTGNDNDHAIIDYQFGLSSAYTYSKNNPEGIEGPSPVWRKGAAVFNKLMETAKKEGFDFTDNIRRYTTKLLFLYSENNTAYGQAYANELASAFVNVQVSEVKGTGHEMIYFKWDNVNALVLPYLNSLR